MYITSSSIYIHDLEPSTRPSLHANLANYLLTQPRYIWSQVARNSYTTQIARVFLPVTTVCSRVVLDDVQTMGACSKRHEYLPDRVYARTFTCAVTAMVPSRFKLGWSVIVFKHSPSAQVAQNGAFYVRMGMENSNDLLVKNPFQYFHSWAN